MYARKSLLQEGVQSHLVFRDSSFSAGVMGAGCCLSSWMETKMYATRTAFAATIAVIAAYVEFPEQCINQDGYNIRYKA